MSVHSLEAPGLRRSGWARRAAERLAKSAGQLSHAARRHASPAIAHIQEHGYTLAAGASFSTAGFIHSVFTGFIVTGVCLLAIEFKVRG